MIYKKGLTQIVTMISLLVLAITLPVLSKVIKQNQDTRRKATEIECGNEGQECCFGLHCNDPLLCFPYYDDKDSSGSGTIVKKICAKPGADVTATPTPIKDLRCDPMIGCHPDCSCGPSSLSGADNTLCLECEFPAPTRDPRCHPMIGCLPDCSCGPSSLPGADNNLCLGCEFPTPTRDPKCDPMIGCIPDCSCGLSTAPGADNEPCRRCGLLPSISPPMTPVPTETIIPEPTITITSTPEPSEKPTDVPGECEACKKIGDYNCDGTVNGLDYSWWKQEFVDKIQHDGKWEASYTCSEVVGPEDFSAWRDSYLN